VIAQLRQQVTGLEAALAAARQENVRLQQAVTQHQAEIENLKRQLQEGAGRWVAKPEMVDVVDSLEKHPTLSPYADRTKAISRIVIHHAASSNQATPQVLARHHVHTNNWPGIGYHFVIAQDGAIYQTQRAKTKSNHVGGEPNNFSVGICLIGRFMLTNADGTPREPKDQVPTPAQMRSVDRLVAWLMQEYNVPIEEVMGHRDVWPQSTVCPGDQWLTGATWKTTLRQRVEAVRAGWDATAGRLMEHYLLLWDHGNQWANADWQSAQKYIAHFRPTVGFSVQDAMLARHVTIVGGEAGVSGIDEARLRAAGVEVHRLAGANEAETKAMLENLVARNTLWPGAPPFKRTALSPVSQGQAIAVASAPVFDPWDVPDERVALAEPAGTRGPVAPRRVKVHPVALPEMPASGPSRRGRRGARRASNQ
jgi:N-acetyl-anhydromuramyl-L-alanine amidase AmpD